MATMRERQSEEVTEFNFNGTDDTNSNKTSGKDTDSNIEISDVGNITVEVVDDTPPKDRNKKAAEPPGEVTEEELESYSEKVRKRIQHFSRGYHDERRRAESAEKDRQEALRIAEMVAEENRKLKADMSKSQEALLEQAKKAAALELEQAKKAYKNAYEAGDSDAVVDAQEALTAAKMKVDRVTNFKLPALQDDKEGVQIPKSAPETKPVDEKAATWADKNKWFGTDDEMTSFALGLHNKLVKQGVDPTSSDYYEKIDSRMRQVFPEAFEDSDDDEEYDEPVEKPKRKPNVVASATRTAAPKKIKLTERQVSLAKKLGVPLELYARQIAEEMRKQNG